MANCIGDFLQQNNIDPTSIVKRARHGIHLDKPYGTEATFWGKPVYYLDGSEWKPIDTRLILQTGNYYGAPGVPVRFNLSDKSVEIVGGTWAQRTTRVGIYRPSTKEILNTLPVPIGSLDNDCLRADGVVGGAGWEHVLRLTEDGVREELILDSRPTIAGVQATDYLVIETRVLGNQWTDGELDYFEQDGMQFYAPSCHDANGLYAPTKRFSRYSGGVQYIYTGIPVSWLASATYPVVLDPDFAGDSSGASIQGVSSDYASARLTVNTYSLDYAGSSGLRLGQYYYSGNGNYFVWRMYQRFDTSSITLSNVVTQANLTFTCTSWNGGVYDVQIIKQNWTAPVNWDSAETNFDGCLSGTQDDSIWRNSWGISVGTAYTSGNLNNSWIVRDGYTYYSFRSSKDAAASAPSGTEYLELATQTHNTSEYRPKLTVLYETPSHSPSASPSASASNSPSSSPSASGPMLSGEQNEQCIDLDWGP